MTIKKLSQTQLSSAPSKKIPHLQKSLCLVKIATLIKIAEVANVHLQIKSALASQKVVNAMQAKEVTKIAKLDCTVAMTQTNVSNKIKWVR